MREPPSIRCAAPIMETAGAAANSAAMRVRNPHSSAAGGGRSEARLSALFAALAQPISATRAGAPDEQTAKFNSKSRFLAARRAGIDNFTISRRRDTIALVMGRRRQGHSRCRAFQACSMDFHRYL